MTILLDTIQSWQDYRRSIPPTLSIGFVPTMGNLHLGHAHLLRKAKAENDVCILSLFVNPTQFNDPEDYARYPKSIDADIHLANDLGVDAVFMPSNEDIYPKDDAFRIHEQH